MRPKSFLVAGLVLALAGCRTPERQARPPSREALELRWAMREALRVENQKQATVERAVEAARQAGN